MSMVRKAVIPVAGMGTRFFPVSKSIPKEMLPIVDKPVIQVIVEELVASGIEEIVFITSEDKDSIENHFAFNEGIEAILTQRGKEDRLESIRHLHTMATFVSVAQKQPLGLGHAVLQAKDVIGNEPFIVCGGDDIIESEVPAAQQLIAVYEQHQAPVLGVLHVEGDAIERYGVLDVAEDLGDGVMRAADIIEKPAAKDAPSQYGVGGRWLLTGDIFGYLEQTNPDEGGEVQLTDGIRAYIADHPVYARSYDGTYRDCGNKLEYMKTVVSFGLQHPEVGESFAAHLKQLDL